LIEIAGNNGNLKMNSRMRRAAGKALARLLQSSTRSDLGLLSERHLKDLRENLIVPSQPELTVSIMNAWQIIGGRSELSIVEKFADDSLPFNKSQDVLTAAKACLPYLRAIAEAEKQRNTLLRAATPAIDSEVSLLRPAASVPEAAEAQLLRPAE